MYCRLIGLFLALIGWVCFAPTFVSSFGLDECICSVNDGLCDSCIGDGCVCPSAPGTLMNSGEVWVGLNRRDVRQQYSIKVIDGGKYISAWTFFVRCMFCANEIQIQTAHEKISSARTGRLLFETRQLNTYSIETVRMWYFLGIPSNDTIAISIIGEPNPFWLWGGRTFWWRLTPIWTPLPPVPISPPIDTHDPSPPESVPGGNGELPTEPHTEQTPTLPHLKTPPIPWWGYVISVAGIIVTLVIAGGCFIKHFRDYKARQQFTEDSLSLLDHQESDMEPEM